ncbi:MAG: ribose-phosphate pyrophosphokinase [Patescibacteria group bacterium]|nr:ribose-phosphate pyrophosphokinase [Patescibacteria group bacterium]
MKLFAGSSNQPLAEKIAQELKTPLANSETVHFADGEVRVRLIDNVKDEICAVVQSTSIPGDANLMELYQFGDLLKQGRAKKIIAVVPYLAYARQDKEHREGEAVSVRLVAKFMESSGYTDAVFLDLHSENAVNFFKIPVLSLDASQTFSCYLDQKRDDFGGGDLVIVAPDAGRKQEVEQLAGALEVDYAVVKKERNLDKTDEINREERLIFGGVAQKEAIIFDDMISTGSTAVSAAYLALKKGAFHVFLCATHAVLSRGDPFYWQNSPFEKIIVSDSIYVPKPKQFEKLEIVSVAPLIAKSLKNLL